MKFVANVPAKQRRTGIRLEVEDMVDVLKSQPGTPALCFDVEDNLSPQTASNRAAMFKSYDGVDAVTRTVDGKGTVYAVFGDFAEITRNALGV